MIIVFLGPPGSGKGTQAKLLSQKLGSFYFEAGKILRQLATKKTKIGRKINKIINQKGALVPDEIMSWVLEDFLKDKNLKKGIIFDGFPRSLNQYQILKKNLEEKNLKIDKVFYLKTKEKTVVFRLSQRRICPKCGFEYNLVTRPPKKDEICDFCQIKLIQRTDDTPEVIRARFKTFKTQTTPIIKLARKQGILEELNGEEEILKIHKEILKRIK